MSWREITEQDVLTGISAAELNAVRQAAIADGQADPVLPTVAQVVAEVRGFVAACSFNTLGPDNTIPDELLGHAIAIIVPRLCSRVAGLALDANHVRSTASATALQVLRDVAACRFRIVQPEEASTANVASPSPKIAERTTYFDRCNQDGI